MEVERKMAGDVGVLSNLFEERVEARRWKCAADRTVVGTLHEMKGFRRSGVRQPAEKCDEMRWGMSCYGETRFAAAPQDSLA